MPSRSPTFDPRSSKPVVGLIGGIGSGKSLVAAEFARRGACIISGDALGHEGLLQPELRARVVKRWGTELLDRHGEIERRKLGSIVFDNSVERQELEAILFPWIEQGIRRQIAEAQTASAAKLTVLDAAIMLEAGWDHLCDWLVYIHAPRETRLRRLAEQRGWTEKEVEARQRAQMSLTDRVSRAHYAVDNSASLEQIARQVETLLRLWKIDV